ncbi:MAG: DGQHR domain-containing protein [Candidatus Freyarchaeota archaeon]
MKIRGCTVKQGDITFYVGCMKVKDLITGRVDTFVASHQEGYQRLLSQARARAFARFMENKGSSPASILVNFRKGKVYEEPEGFVNLPDGETMWIVDGQHRVEGLRLAAERDASLSDLEFPVVIMNYPSEYEEAKQFVVINKTQKGVRTDLAERFLFRAIKEEGRKALIELRERGALRPILKNIEWVAKAIEIADFLNKDEECPWFKRIQLPNEPKNGATVAQKSFTDSLEPLLKDSFFQGKDSHSIALALRNYWNAIRELCEAAFETPREYVIQKTTGVFVLHKVFPRVSEFCRDERGNRVLTKERFKAVLEPLPMMNSEYWATNGEAGKRGTGKKGFAMLAMEFLEALEASGQTGESDLIV